MDGEGQRRRQVDGEGQRRMTSGWRRTEEDDKWMEKDRGGRQVDGGQRRMTSGWRRTEEDDKWMEKDRGGRQVNGEGCR